MKILKKQGRRYYKYSKDTPDAHKVGTPMVRDGILSGLGTASYYFTHLPFSEASNWEIVWKGTTPTTFPSYCNLFTLDCSSYGFLAYFNSSTMRVHFSSNRSSWDIASNLEVITVQPNTLYWFKFEYTGTEYVIHVSYDGVEWEERIRIANATRLPFTCDDLYIGYRKAYTGEFWPGTIDLNEMYVKMNGKIVWRGMRAFVSTEEDYDFYKDEVEYYTPTLTTDVDDSRYNKPKITMYLECPEKKVAYKHKQIYPGYKQVEFIQSNGSQYIQTDYKPPTSLIKIRYVCEFIRNNNNQCLWCTRGATTTTTTLTSFYISGSGIRTDYNTVTVQTNAGRHLNYKYEFIQDGLNFYENGKLKTTHTQAEFVPTQPMSFLASFYNGTYTNIENYSYQKLYHVQIWENDILVRDFLPCERIVDSALGLFDTITNMFYSNQGTFIDFDKGNYILEECNIEESDYWKARPDYTIVEF